MSTLKYLLRPPHSRLSYLVSARLLNYRTTHRIHRQNKYLRRQLRTEVLQETTIKMALSPGDPNSFSTPELAAVTHTHLDLSVDFQRKILTGSVVLDVEKRNATDELILDNRGIIILTILNAIDGSNLNYNISEDVQYGSKLSIKLPENAVSSNEDILKYKIEIRYETSPEASALQWLTPEQTAGGKHPYLFSQCQAIHARSMLPCQDTPSVKSTYSAAIKAPAELVVLMSAQRKGIKDEGNTKIHTFHQPVPIPSYLIAIAVGALVSKEVGPRSRVWAEKEFINQSAYEFGETEMMLKTAEDICGPYIWGIYDLLVLPPSFPFGGMENPCLTFVTPTLLAGDRSLASVVAHEISHSWTGNLVTNANFEHFWLNEGFTMFVERKIDGRMFGDKVRQFSALSGIKALREGINTIGETNQLTSLVPNLTGVDPDDAFSIVPYEKGHTFLYYLEELLGGPAEFEPFLKEHLEKFKYKSIVTSDWKAFLYSYFSDKREILNSVDWETWLNKPGMPPVIPNYDTSLADACIALAKKWINWNENTSSIFSKSDIANLTANQKREFLVELFSANETLSVKKLEAMQAAYDFDSVKNSEIRFMWLRICIKGRWESKVLDALAFATQQGRMKFVRPIFRDLYAWEATRQRAIDAYLANKSKMMYVSAHTIAKDLHLIEKTN
ncbi:leukotriene A-4 hydrolase [Cephus cinctus]|uniref:Leukotriene A(4) hydrolase n=1 Tax=Cephus cinctus TaxID=211228 RepID=A0AAJ7W2C3_CEPCN|nr:leukotriene A-4 hydrolase [Cephus cinctus]